MYSQRFNVEKHATTSHTNTVMKNVKGMKVGDLVTWYGPDGQDIGLVTEYCILWMVYRGTLVKAMGGLVMTMII